MKINFEVTKSGPKMVRRLSVSHHGKTVCGVDMVDDELTAEDIAVALRRFAGDIEKRG